MLELDGVGQNVHVGLKRAAMPLEQPPQALPLPRGLPHSRRRSPCAGPYPADIPKAFFCALSALRSASTT
jgi:hypothetical protein